MANTGQGLQSSITVLLLITALAGVSLGWFVDRQHCLQQKADADRAFLDAQRKARETNTTLEFELQLERNNVSGRMKLLNEHWANSSAH